jgi:sulfopyruvate decarboxylase subunit alpha
LGGARPVVMIQCTGLFESGDALRNVLFDYKLPLFALVGYRSYLSQTAIPNDSARTFTEPILKAWGIDYRLIDVPAKKGEIVEHYHRCQSEGRPGCVLIAEGKG